MIENKVLFAAREALQTPVGSGEHNDPALLAPCELSHTGLAEAIDHLPEHPNVHIELPNALSSPSATHLVSASIARAESIGVIDQVPVHTRMAESDFDQAVRECGARAIHLFGNCSENGGKRDKGIGYWIANLERIAKKADAYGVVSMRASMEHATNTPPEDILLFIQGVMAVNGQYDNPIITDLGIPDTNGSATPTQYTELFSMIGGAVRDADLRVHTHLHDDNGLANENAQSILHSAGRLGIPVTVEASHAMYPGERVGIRPFISETDQFGFSSHMMSMDMLEGAVTGSSWRDHAHMDMHTLRQIHVAGVHTDNMGGYADEGHEPHPAHGLYGIMGKGNIGFWQREVYGAQSDRGVLAATAMIGRELSGQHGNQRHGYALALSELALREPALMVQTAQSFGPPETWLERDIPDLSSMKHTLDSMVAERWGDGV